MSGVTRLIVVRHGNTFNSGDVILRVGSATDIPLTEKGVAQGEAVGRELAARGFAVEQIFFAPLQRTRRSAEGIAGAYPGVAMESAEFLTELDYGQDDGKPEDDVVLRLGIAESCNALTPEVSLDELRESGKNALKKWDSEAVLPAGWSFLAPRVAELEKNWQDFADMIVEKFSGRTVVAVTSNGIARFSKVILPENSNLDGSLKLATGAFGVYEYADGVWQCAKWNIRPEL